MRIQKLKKKNTAEIFLNFVLINNMFKLQEKWFKMADNERATRRTDPMNIRIQAARLETRRNFFSHRVPEAWKGVVPRDIRQARTAQAFKKAYKDHRRQMVAIS
jgi:hypothetical protein